MLCLHVLTYGALDALDYLIPDDYFFLFLVVQPTVTSGASAGVLIFICKHGRRVRYFNYLAIAKPSAYFMSEDSDS